MPKSYSHLSQSARRIMEHMLMSHCSKREIAHQLRVHISTIYRELKRNNQLCAHTKKNYYECRYAHRSYLRRRKRACRLEKVSWLRELVHKKLRTGWSPWQIEWFLKKRHHRYAVTHETIYRYIYRHWKRRNEFTPYLRRRHRCRVKQGTRKSRIDKQLMIFERDYDANERISFGHWECDLMIFKRGCRENLITLTERKTRYTIAIKNGSKQAKSTALAIIARLTPLKQHVKSITFDQGGEFSRYALIASCLTSKIYFCEPGAPHQKGGIENRNGVIRTVFPRDHDILSTTQEKIDKVLQMINERPMRCLSFESPETLFQQEISR